MESLYILSLDGKVLIEKNYSPSRNCSLIPKLYSSYFSSQMKLDDQYPCLYLNNHWCLFLCSNDVIIITITSTD